MPDTTAFNAADTPRAILPLPGERWVPRRKAMVIAALREGEITVEEVCRLYSLSRDELASWVASFERYGVPGLRATREQLYRQLEKAIGGRAHQPSAPDRASPQGVATSGSDPR
jgi:transposase-like protein